MKLYTKLTIAIYIVELFMIGLIVGLIYFSVRPILDTNPELLGSGISMFVAGFITHKYLRMKWVENINKIFNPKEELKH